MKVHGELIANLGMFALLFVGQIAVGCRISMATKILSRCMYGLHDHIYKSRKLKRNKTGTEKRPCVFYFRKNVTDLSIFL